jgi:hypothetical protein
MPNCLCFVKFLQNIIYDSLACPIPDTAPLSFVLGLMVAVPFSWLPESRPPERRAKRIQAVDL